MIRLIDCDVYAVEKKDITRSGLFSFFCNRHTEDLVVVYSEGIYEGVISYKKLLNTANENVDDIMNKKNIFVNQMISICFLIYQKCLEIRTIY